MRSSTLRGRIESLGSQVDSLPRDGEPGVLKSRLEEVLAVALALFGQISVLKGPEADSTALPLYAHWLRGAGELLPLLRTAKRTGCRFTNTPKFMRAYLEAQAVVASVTGATEGGERKSLDEVERELSHRG